MKTGFKGPISSKQELSEKLCYDERSGFFMSTGTNYGVGHKQPVGSEGPGEMRANVLPFGSVKTARTDEAR